MATKYDNKEKEYVRAYFISPSMLEDKWKGETERKIRTLFDEARNNKEWKATFIFIDEIDSFFDDRMKEVSEITTIPKSEFLNLLSGISEDLMSNCFLLGATNMLDNINPAFSRRMGNQYLFDFPDKEEIKKMLSEITENWPKSETSEEILNTVSRTLGERKASQSLIADITKKLLIACGDKEDRFFNILKEGVKNAENNFQRKDRTSGLPYNFKSNFTISDFSFYEMN